MLKNLIAASAVASLALVPVAAQANTRASAAGVALAATPPGAADDDDGDEGGWLEGEGLGAPGQQFSRAWLFAMFGAAAAAIGLVIEASGGVVVDEPVSPGT